MGDDKVLRIELARERSHENGYYYSTLDLPAEEHEIRDALQKARISGAHLNHHDLSILYCEDISELQGLRLDAPTIDELNFLSKRIAGMDLMERRLYAAVLPHAIGDDDIVSMRTLINCTYGLDEVPVAANVSNDEQLGQFIIDNELHGDVNAVPEDSLYLLDRKKIGQLYRTTYGCVYQGSLTIFAGDYEMPEVYDGQCLPESSPTQWYAFRLKLASAADAVWVELPMQKEKEAEIARQLGVSDLRECECTEFRSSVPQITAQQFGDMADFDMLNQIAAVMAEMSSGEQVTFKAVLVAEAPEDLDGVMDVAEHLSEYELDTLAAEESEFFRHYLCHHLDSRVDPLWLDEVQPRQIGATLLGRLGASMTDYGVISARGRSLYEPVPFREPEQKVLTTQGLTDEKLEVVEILGQTGLFSNGRVTQKELPEGLYKYDLRQGEGVSFATIEPIVKSDHAGTVLFKAPLDFGDAEYFVFDEDTAPNFLGYELTPTEFMETDFDQDEDEDLSMQMGGMTQ